MIYTQYFERTSSNSIRLNLVVNLDLWKKNYSSKLCEKIALSESKIGLSIKREKV